MINTIWDKEVMHESVQSSQSSSEVRITPHSQIWKIKVKSVKWYTPKFTLILKQKWDSNSVLQLHPSILSFLLPAGFQIIFFKEIEVYCDFSFIKDGLGDFPKSCTKRQSQAHSVTAQSLIFTQPGTASLFPRGQTGSQ